MDHENLKEKVFALYDGELDAEGQIEAKKHLMECQECATLYRRWESAAKTLFSQPKSAGSEFFVRQVMNQIKTPAVTKSVFVWNTAWWRALVPVVGFAMVFLTLMQPVENPISMDGMIAGDSIESGSSKIFSANPPTLDDTLTMVMEGSL